jgi:hypothetical protein
MPLSTIFQLYRGDQFYWWTNPGCLEKTTDLSQVRQTLSHTLFIWDRRGRGRMGVESTTTYEISAYHY